MDISKLKEMPYDELRVLYKQHLHSLNISKATINTASVDTFYLWRNGSKDLFWNAVTATDMVLMTDTIFTVIRYNHSLKNTINMSQLMMSTARNLLAALFFHLITIALN